MNSTYTSMDLAMEIDGIESVYQTAAIFDHYEVFVASDQGAANDDPYEDYDNLYLVPN